MTARYYATEKQIEAISYELAERFLKRIGGAASMQDTDDLAAAISAIIKAWVAKSATIELG